MTYARMHLYPPQLPHRLRIEVAASVAPGDGATYRPADLPVRLRRSPLDPPFSGGPFVDVLLEGSAVPAAARATTASVVMSIGDWKWSAAVFGARKALSIAGSIAMSDPLPIEAPVPIAFETAYGGGETTATDEPMALERDIDTRRVYPRNPFGRGYRRGLGHDSWDLPQVEDPDDLITDARLERVARDGWEVAPLPWCLDEVHALTYPRVAMLAGMGPEIVDASSGLEVRRGYLVSPDAGSEAPALDPRFLQDAPPWGWLPTLTAGTPIELRGCLPRGETFALTLPEAPRLVVTMEGRSEAIDARPARLTIRPDMREVVVVWTGDIALSRPFLPGVHKRIPIEVQLGDAAPVPYPTPPVPPRPPFRSY